MSPVRQSASVRADTSLHHADKLLGCTHPRALSGRAAGHYAHSSMHGAAFSTRGESRDARLAGVGDTALRLECESGDAALVLANVLHSSDAILDHLVQRRAACELVLDTQCLKRYAKPSMDLRCTYQCWSRTRTGSVKFSIKQ